MANGETRSRLTYRNESIKLHEFEKITVSLCKHSFERSGSCVVAGPFGYLAVLLAIELVLHYYTTDISFPGNPKKRPEILVISKINAAKEFIENMQVDTDFISHLSVNKIYMLVKKYGREINLNMDDPYNGHLYWKHFIKKRYDTENIPERLPIHYFVPTARIGKDGRIFLIGPRDHFGRYDTQNPAVYLSSFFDAVHSAANFDTIICDYSFLPRGEIVRSQQEVPIIHIFDNLTDDRILKLHEKGAEIFAWTPERLLNVEAKCGICSERVIPQPVIGSCLVGSILKRTLPEIMRCEDPAEDMFIKAERNLKKMLRAVKRGTCDQKVEEMVRRASYAYRVLTELPVKPETYDIVAGITGNTFTILDLLNELSIVSRTMHIDANEVKVLIYETCRLFQKINDVLGERNCKMLRLIAEVKRYVESGCRTIVLTVNATAAAALKRNLREFLGQRYSDIEDELLHIIPYRNLKRLLRELHSRSMAADVTVVSGTDRRMLSDVILMPPSERTVMVLYGRELHALIGLLGFMRNRLIQINRSNKIAEGSDVGGDAEYLKAIEEKTAGISKDKPGTGILKVSFIDAISRITAEIDEGRYIPYCTATKEAEGYEGRMRRVPAREVVFTDGSRMFCAIDDTLRIINATGSDIGEVAVGELKPGDRVLIIRGNSRNTLYDLILDEIENQTQVDLDSRYIRYWQNSIRDAFYVREVSYEEIHERLVREGSRITSPVTIGTWIRGDVMGPQDPLDIKRMGVILGKNELCRSWKRIYEAMRRIRNIHKAVAVQLNRAIINSVGSEILAEGEDDYLSQWGLCMEDFRRAVAIKTVEHVHDEVRCVSPAETGVVFCY